MEIPGIRMEETEEGIRVIGPFGEQEIKSPISFAKCMLRYLKDPKNLPLAPILAPIWTLRCMRKSK